VLWSKELMATFSRPLLTIAFLVAQQGAFAVDADLWLQYNRDGESALAANNYGVAEKNFNRALQEAEKFGGADKRLATTLRNLASLYTARGQFAKVEPLLERELRVKEKMLGGDHPDVISAVGKLTQFYLSHGNASKADKLSALLLSFAQKRLAELNKVDVPLSQLSSYYSSHAGYTESQALLKQLQESTVKTRANHSLELATTLDALGGLYKGKGRLPLSEQMYKTALALREKNLPADHMALAVSYENLATLYSEQGKTAQAEPLYKKSLDVTEKSLQIGRPEVFYRLDNLARTHLSLGQTAEAEALYKRALTILERSPNNSRDLGNSSYALGMLYLRQGKAALSEPQMKRALRMGELNNGPAHASLIPILDNYAEVLEKLNRAGDASKLRTRAKTIRGVSVVHDSENGADF
jgi:tetratricopeptide (TPR) repeat protein